MARSQTLRAIAFGNRLAGNGVQIELKVTVNGEQRSGGSRAAAHEGLAEQQTMRNGQNNKRMRGRNRKRWPSSPKSVVAHVRVQRTGRENPWHRVPRRGKISPARPRRAKFRRSDRRRKLLSARRTLFPPDRRRAGTVATDPALLPAAAGDMRGNSADDGYDDGDDQPQVRRAVSRRRRSRSIRANSSSSRSSSIIQPQQQQPQPQSFQPRPQQQPAASERPMTAMSNGCRRSSPAASRSSSPQQQRRARNGQAAATAQNGYEGSADRFPLHRRRRRHRGGGRAIYGAPSSRRADGIDESRAQAGADFEPTS